MVRLQGLEFKLIGTIFVAFSLNLSINPSIIDCGIFIIPRFLLPYKQRVVVSYKSISKQSWSHSWSTSFLVSWCGSYHLRLSMWSNALPKIQNLISKVIRLTHKPIDMSLEVLKDPIVTLIGFMFYYFIYNALRGLLKGRYPIRGTFLSFKKIISQLIGVLDFCTLNLFCLLRIFFFESIHLKLKLGWKTWFWLPSFFFNLFNFEEIDLFLSNIIWDLDSRNLTFSNKLWFLEVRSLILLNKSVF